MTLKLLGLALLGVSLSNASVIILDGNNPVPPEYNVLLNQGQIGTMITGSFNQSLAIADFTSNESITSPANGQARIIASDGTLSNLVISLEGGYTFGDLIFAINRQNGNVANPTVSIMANGTLSGDVVLTPSTTITAGNQFFTIRATGETLNSVTIAATNSSTLQDIRQLRFSEITAPDGGGGGGGGGSQVPEPTSLALLGGGLTFLGLIRKLK